MEPAYVTCFCSFKYPENVVLKIKISTQNITLCKNIYLSPLKLTFANTSMGKYRKCNATQILDCWFWGFVGLLHFRMFFGLCCFNGQTPTETGWVALTCSPGPAEIWTRVRESLSLTTKPSSALRRWGEGGAEHLHADKVVVSRKWWGQVTCHRKWCHI